MLKLEKFDGTKTYMFPNGAVATPEAIRKQFPAVDHFPHVIEVNGDVCQAVINLNALANIHEVDSELAEVDKIAAIETKMNAPVEVIVQPEERLAAAAEFQNIIALPDTLEVAEMDHKVIKKNVKAGLWGKAHLDVVKKKGLITKERADTILAETLA